MRASASKRKFVMPTYSVVCYETFKTRLRRGWPVEKAARMPADKKMQESNRKREIDMNSAMIKPRAVPRRDLNQGALIFNSLPRVRA